MINRCKYILVFALMLMCTALVPTSCAKTDFDEPIINGDTVEVSFRTTIDDITTSRAWDGRNINKLYVELYYNSTKVGDRYVYDVNNGTIERFSISLLKNQTYRAVFWAQKSDCDAYNIDNFNSIIVNYNTSADTIADRDAFYASIEFTVNSDTQRDGVDVDLRRPFALVAAGTQATNLTTAPTSTTLTISKVSTVFNAVTGKTSVDAQVTANFDFTVNSNITVPGKSEVMLGMAYVLPLNDVPVNVTISTTVGSDTKQTTLNIEKLEANKQYNILGNLLPAN